MLLSGCIIKFNNIFNLSNFQQFYRDNLPCKDCDVFVYGCYE